MTAINPDTFYEFDARYLLREAWRDISADIQLYQNGNITSTVTYAYAITLAKTTFIDVLLTATAAGTATNNIYILLPAVYTPNSGISVNKPIGVGEYLDNGSALYSGKAVYVATVSSMPAIALKIDTVTDGNVIGVNPNIAVASNDVMSLNLVFERT